MLGSICSAASAISIFMDMVQAKTYDLPIISYSTMISTMANFRNCSCRRLRVLNAICGAGIREILALLPYNGMVYSAANCRQHSHR